MAKSTIPSTTKTLKIRTVNNGWAIAAGGWDEPYLEIQWVANTPTLLTELIQDWAYAQRNAQNDQA
jgi:hypothetical protein